MRLRNLGKLAARFAAALLAGALAASTPAQEESVLDQPIEKEGWPTEIARRPLTLARDMLEVVVPLDVTLTARRAGEPVFLAPSLYYGVTDALTLGLRHFDGLCLSGSAHGCRKTYQDLGIDALWRLRHESGSDLAVAASLDASPISDPFTLSGEVRLIGRIGGPIALALAPTLNFGLNERNNSALVKATALAFPLSTYPFGWVELSSGNREFLSIPVSIILQLTPRIAVSVAGALDGPLDPPVGDFGDFYRVPVGVAVIASPSNRFDAGASFTLLNLLGKQLPGGEPADQRGLQIFAALRI
jgi:hypothetical protein